MSEPNLILRASRDEIRALNEPVIASMQAKLRDALQACVGPDQDYALIDFPNYANIGDSAIYVGETILCMEHFGRRPALVTTASPVDFDAIGRLDAQIPILMQGGGNFGDLYPRHQQFRNAVLERFRERKIVLFPQSIHFEDERNAERTARAIAAHPHFTMMVRDEASMATARRLFDCPVMLVPDMAFMLGVIDPPVQADLRVMALMRSDKESVVGEDERHPSLPKPSVVVDWPKEKRSRRLLDALPASLRRLLPPPAQSLRPCTPAAFEWLARKRLQTGFEMLSRGEIVLSDRLHAHILSLLLCRPQIALDNRYRKIGNFVDAWTNGGGVVQASSLSEAIAQINSMSVKPLPGFGT